ncbi:MAG: restriction endonuclease subunit S, partial [Gammaproteobacteria bacterium]
EELLSVTQDRGVIPRRLLEGRVMSPEGSTANYKRIKKGDFAISLRSFQGGIEYSDYQGIISPAYTVLRPKAEIDIAFYRLFFKTYLFIEKYLNIAVIGIRDGKQISIPDFMSIKIPRPPIEEQKSIAGVLTIAQKEIDLLKQLAERYKSQKRGLMQKLLTGQWRVKMSKEVA